MYRILRLIAIAALIVGSGCGTNSTVSETATDPREVKSTDPREVKSREYPPGSGRGSGMSGRARLDESPPVKVEVKEIPFDTYEINYIWEIPRQSQEHRIDCFSKGKKVGQITFRSDGPSTYREGYADLHFFWNQYEGVVNILQHETNLVLHVEMAWKDLEGPPYIRAQGLASRKVARDK